MKLKLNCKAISLALALVSVIVATSSPSRAAGGGWQVGYDEKGGVTVKVGDAIVFTDANALMLVNTKPWHGVYGWSLEPWATNFAHPSRVDTTKGEKKIITFSDPAGQPVQVTKQITEISPRELKIVVKVNTAASSPGNLLDYSGYLPGAVYLGATLSTDGIGYDLSEVSPLTAEWPAAHNNGHGDDLRYNITTATFALKDLAGSPAKIVYTMTETPVSPGTPPNVRGWRVYSGIDSQKAQFCQIRSTYEFDPAAPFERDLELRIAWK
ncbi:MAG: hypothetical protein P4L33_16380 [Capsulimonadaceae bacterium]|nr:hypothetical protein [Capsulimonadaceae bacterium]